MKITFDNGYKAYLVYNEISKTNVAQLYSPEGVFLTSVQCMAKEFDIAANALMYGYFAGWSKCKQAMKESVLSACDIEMVK